MNAKNDVKSNWILPKPVIFSFRKTGYSYQTEMNFAM
jgi:hypothetical protein